MGNETVTIYVGNKRKRFTIHKKLLCDQSDYFLKAFTSGFKEREEGEMYLPEDSPEVMAIFVNFLYRGQIDECEDQEEQPSLKKAHFMK